MPWSRTVQGTNVRKTGARVRDVARYRSCGEVPLGTATVAGGGRSVRDSLALVRGENVLSPDPDADGSVWLLLLGGLTRLDSLENVVDVKRLFGAFRSSSDTDVAPARGCRLSLARGGDLCLWDDGRFQPLTY